MWWKNGYFGDRKPAASREILIALFLLKYTNFLNHKGTPSKKKGFLTFFFIKLDIYTKKTEISFRYISVNFRVKCQWKFTPFLVSFTNEVTWSWRYLDLFFASIWYVPLHAIEYNKFCSHKNQNQIKQHIIQSFDIIYHHPLHHPTILLHQLQYENYRIIVVVQQPSLFHREQVFVFRC